VIGHFLFQITHSLFQITTPALRCIGVVFSLMVSAFKVVYEPTLTDSFEKKKQNTGISTLPAG